MQAGKTEGKVFTEPLYLAPCGPHTFDSSDGPGMWCRST